MMGKYSTEFEVVSRNGGVAMVQTQQQAIFPFPGLPKETVYTDAYDRPSWTSSMTRVFISKDRDAVCWNGANGYDPFFSYQNCFNYFKNISKEKDLSYVVRDLGHYHLRQVVTSKDGSTIKYYHVFVNSQFEEGFTILGRRPDGLASISFMKTLTPEEIEAGMKPSFVQNAFAYANEGKELYADPVDIDKVGKYLYILHGESQKMIQIDAKTFKEVYEYDFKYYQLDFLPGRLMAYDGKIQYGI